MSDEKVIFIDADQAPVPPEVPEQLRQRAADVLERGLQFVEANGDERALMRAHVVLQARPRSVWIETISAQQNPDGSFPPRPALEVGLVGRELGDACERDPAAATWAALSFLAEDRALAAPCVDAAARFCLAAQHDDGSFGDETLGERRRLILTGLLAGCLGRTSAVRPELLAAAGDYLTERWAPERIEGQGLGPLLAYSHYFANAPHDAADEVLQWCGRELEKGFRSRARDALATARVLMTCDAASLPGSEIGPEELLRALLDEQASDGGFDALAPEGVPGRVIPTIEGLRAIVGVCAGLDP